MAHTAWTRDTKIWWIFVWHLGGAHEPSYRDLVPNVAFFGLDLSRVFRLWARFGPHFVARLINRPMYAQRPGPCWFSTKDCILCQFAPLRPYLKAHGIVTLDPTSKQSTYVWTYPMKHPIHTLRRPESKEFDWESSFQSGPPDKWFWSLQLCPLTCFTLDLSISVIGRTRKKHNHWTPFQRYMHEPPKANPSTPSFAKWAIWKSPI